MLVWGHMLFKKTIIDENTFFSIILFFGSIEYIIDRRKYSSTYQMNWINIIAWLWINIMAWLQSTLSWGFIICTLFMASNTFFGNNESITKDYQIENISDMSGTKSRRSKQQILVRINYDEKIKELVFPNNYISNINNYKLVKLKTREGFFGFDIIEEQTLIENELENVREKK